MAESVEVERKLEKLTQQIAELLKAQGKKVVFAESCTGGKMAASLTAVPGVSEIFCGSAVTYRSSTKTQWLSIAASEIEDHTAESEFTTVKMAESVLAKTTEAEVAIAITGHLGPGVDAEIDGRIFVVSAQRKPESTNSADAFAIVSASHQLVTADRKQRQAEAACFAFEVLLDSVR